MKLFLRRYGLALIALLGIAMCVLLMGGCSTRETARAQLQADQSLAGAQHLAAGKAVGDVLATLTPEARAVLEPIIRNVLLLMGSARESLAPGLRLLAKGEPVQVETTPEQAARDPAAFAAAAARQRGRADVEVDRIETWRGMAQAGLQIGLDLVGGAGGSWWSQLLLGVGGGGITLATILASIKGFAGARAAPQLTKALQMTADFADDVANAVTDEDVAAVKAKHQARQEQAGVRPLIQRVRGKG